MVDERIIVAAQSGDREAFENLVRDVERPMLRFFHRLSGNVEKARDLRQELFYKLVRVLPRYDRRKASFNTWLYRMARNLAIDKLYRPRRLNTESLDETHENLAPPGLEMEFPRRSAARGELRDALAEAVSSLPELDRTIIALKHDEELTFQEIAKTVGIPVSAVKSRLYRSFERLRRELRARGYHCEP